jgi:hypothetical protein
MVHSVSRTYDCGPKVVSARSNRSSNGSRWCNGAAEFRRVQSQRHRASRRARILGTARFGAPAPPITSVTPLDVRTPHRWTLWSVLVALARDLGLAFHGAGARPLDDWAASARCQPSTSDSLAWARLVHSRNRPAQRSAAPPRSRVFARPRFAWVATQPIEMVDESRHRPQEHAHGQRSTGVKNVRNTHGTVDAIRPCQRNLDPDQRSLMADGGHSVEPCAAHSNK